jgi:hypothetical protein
MKKNKRPQAQKPRRSADHQRQVLEMRQGNAAQPHRPATDYRRSPKHRNQGWDY